MQATLSKFFDKLLENTVSREFQVYVVATILFGLKLINQETWLMLSLGFMGFRTAQKLLPNNNSNNNNKIPCDENNPGV